MDRRLYPSGKFAQKALVSVRTLRYYDKEGLLSPTEYSEAGYRLYSDEDLVNLQQILALKFLGFALDEIKVFIKRGPRSLERVLNSAERDDEREKEPTRHHHPGDRRDSKADAIRRKRLGIFSQSDPGDTNGT